MGGLFSCWTEFDSMLYFNPTMDFKLRKAIVITEWEVKGEGSSGSEVIPRADLKISHAMQCLG